MKNINSIENKIKNEKIQKFLSKAVSLFELENLDVKDDKIELYSIYKKFSSCPDELEPYYVYMGNKDEYFYFIEIECKCDRSTSFNYIFKPKYSVCLILKNPEIKNDGDTISCKRAGIYPDIYCRNTSICNLILDKTFTRNKFQDLIINNIQVKINNLPSNEDLDFMFDLLLH